MTFYELNEAYLDLVSAFIDCESEEEAERLAEEIASISSNIEEKAENYAYVMQNMKAEAAELASKAYIFKKEADRLQKASDGILGKIDRLKKSLLFGMELSGIDKIRTSIGLFYTQKTISVDVLDAWKVPEEFATKQPPKIDKNAIQKAFRRTGEIPEGCDVVQSEGVRFR
ncbi:MAG: siphovirus Gp157 family protein [Clostridia bacterium]|nr:siphovirus Gp157 family protein [Clostridia bacterium]